MSQIPSWTQYQNPFQPNMPNTSPWVWGQDPFANPTSRPPGTFYPPPSTQPATQPATQQSTPKTTMVLPDLNPGVGVASTPKTYMSLPELSIQTGTVNNTPSNIDQPSFQPSPTVAGGQPAPTSVNQPGFQTQYSTPGNLQPYFKPFNFQEDPGYQFALDQGIRALDRSAAAGGLLGSTRNQNDILRFATGLAGQQYQDAWGRNRTENLDALGAFTGDRNYMTDQYWTNRGANLSEADAVNRWNYGLYQDEQKAYQNMMGQFYDMLNSLSQTGQTAADRSGAIESWLGQNLASLYGDIGNVNAGAAQASGANNQNLVEGLLSVFGSLLGGG